MKIALYQKYSRHVLKAISVAKLLTAWREIDLATTSTWGLFDAEEVFIWSLIKTKLPDTRYWTTASLSRLWIFHTELGNQGYHYCKPWHLILTVSLFIYWEHIDIIDLHESKREKKMIFHIKQAYWVNALPTPDFTVAMHRKMVVKFLKLAILIMRAVIRSKKKTRIKGSVHRHNYLQSIS